MWLGTDNSPNVLYLKFCVVDSQSWRGKGRLGSLMLGQASDNPQRVGYAFRKPFELNIAELTRQRSIINATATGGSREIAGARLR